MLADIDAYTTRHGTPSDAGQVGTLIADADSLVHSYAGTKYDTDPPGWVVGLVCGMAHRAATLPAGVRAESFTDAYSISYAAEGSGGAGVWITSDELAVLVGGVVA
jgi:hypothetical protein